MFLSDVKQFLTWIGLLNGTTNALDFMRIVVLNMSSIGSSRAKDQIEYLKQLSNTR